MKVALCFWGLTRSLKYTIYSIQKYILNVLKIHNIEYKIFLHTFVFNSSYYNPRAEEYNIQLDFNEYTLLEPDFVQIDNQDVIKDEINIMKYRTQADPWDSDYICVDNFICAMYSKKQLGIMVQNSNIQFDYIVYLRPDVKYYSYFDKHYFSFANQYNVCTPNFHLYPKLNDRFCILQSDKLLQYSTMFDRDTNKCVLPAREHHWAPLVPQRGILGDPSGALGSPRGPVFSEARPSASD